MALELSEHEQRLLASLKKRHDQWRSLRWLLVVLVVTNFSIAIAEFLDRGWDAMPLIYLLVSAGVAAKLHRDWHGAAATSLLLRLIERETASEA